jgi:hypothetical protein
MTYQHDVEERRHELRGHSGGLAALVLGILIVLTVGALVLTYPAREHVRTTENMTQTTPYVPSIPPATPQDQPN